ncbi:MAG: thioredoxin [Candidatus Omnitrophota bacterium]|jgi:thioredoxin 1
MGAFHLTEKDFQQEVLESSIPVLVDFWAEWCGPCRMMGPIVDDAANDLSGKVRVGKVNVDEAQGLAARYGIMSIPALLVFKDGKVVEQFAGAMPKEQLLQRLKKYV